MFFGYLNLICEYHYFKNRIGPVKLLIGKLFDSVHLNELFHGQTDIEPFKPTIEPSNWTNRPIFLKTDQILIATNVCLLRGPLSIKSIPHPILLKSKMIISLHLVQVISPIQWQEKLIKLIFGSCLQTQFIDMFGLQGMLKVFIEHIKFMCFQCGIGTKTN